MSANTRAVLFALLAFAIFACHDAMIKVLGGSYSPFQIVFFSVVFGFPLITVQMMRDQTMGSLIPRQPGWVVGRTVAAVITGACAFYAFSVLPLAQTYAVLFASPLLITVLAIPVLGEKVGWRRALAVLVGLAGVMVVLQPGPTVLGLGHLSALGAAVFGAISSIIARKVGRSERSEVLILYPMVANFILMACLMPMYYEPMPFADIASVFAVAALALLATSLLIAAYRLGSAASVAPMQYSQIIWASVFGIVFFNETPQISTAIGAAIIVASGLYIVLRENSGASKTTPVLRTRTRWETASGPRVGPMLRLRPELDGAKVGLEPEQKPKGMRGIPGR